MTSDDLLQQLRTLDRSSPEFHDRLSGILYGETYKRNVSRLQDNELVSLVDYLDKVSYRVTIPLPAQAIVGS